MTQEHLYRCQYLTHSFNHIMRTHLRWKAQSPGTFESILYQGSCWPAYQWIGWSTETNFQHRDVPCTLQGTAKSVSGANATWTKRIHWILEVMQSDLTWLLLKERGKCHNKFIGCLHFWNWSQSLSFRILNSGVTFLSHHTRMRTLK